MSHSRNRFKSFVLVFGLIVGTNSYGNEAQETVAELETRLLSAEVISLDFHAVAEGAIEVDLHGRLEIEDNKKFILTATGHFANMPMELTLSATDDALSLGNGESTQAIPRPAALKEAVLIGLTRMGILHNLAMLTAMQPPDHGDGGVQDWVVVDDFSLQGTADIHFAITVAGQPAGETTLQLDSDGLPLLRRQTVKFPDGEMRVTETYSSVTVRPATKKSIP